MRNTPDVFATGRAFSEDEVKGKTVVVIDVLRASSTIVTALHNGARGVIAVEDMGDATRIAQNLDSSSYLLCGEQGGVKIEGFHLGNSPFEYEADVVKGRTLIFNSTNGTPTLVRCSGAKEVIIGSFLNAGAVVERLRETTREILIVCSGWKSRLSFEDMLCAGYLLHTFIGADLPDDAPDGAQLADALYKQYGGNLVASVERSNHGKRLAGLGFEADIPYCCTIDKSNVVPVLMDGLFVPAS
ncbi:2-phosphosulfolactate phosphatase [Cyclonatronum proteinivorum]|uniref:Probable 2-phosphosulfolactate phosphatase n=1 Tax=Cyclonatronum proteinivorum TaxID=1457365 RepID=A0A345UJE1_9BACT|nr:2-phosphosulfolactate phosphatase [Cyclonatronum proteinivorum]AXJ00593.1 2-phosphosulfolactate phosphatase [Cyclonatronum proteinivorum]